MKKTRLLSFLILIAAVSAIFGTQVMMIKADELFGEGSLYYVRTGGVMVGYSPAWGHWLFVGRMESNGMPCTLIKLTGGGAGDARVVQCFARWSKPERFRGWIDFRGHQRPFCGAANSNYPSRCFGE